MWKPHIGVKVCKIVCKDWDGKKNFLSCTTINFILALYLLKQKGEKMKKVILALFAVLTLAACTGSYRSGNCEYDFLLHKDISISKWIGSATGC